MTIKEKYLRISSFLIILILGISFVPAASASSPPSIPNVFEGNLLSDGAHAAVGTVISAYIDSTLVGQNSITEVGKYQLAVSGTEKDNGKKIIFKLGNVESGPVAVTYTHGAQPQNLDLSFTGNFVPPVIETLSVSPIYILNDGEDYSVVRTKVSDDLGDIASVTLDLSPIGKGIVSLTSENGGSYTCDITSTQAGAFKFTFTAADSYGNKATNKDTISITVLKKEELTTRYGGADKVFSADEIKNLVNDNNVSNGIKYSVLNIYFGDGWDRI
jgi:hypothetical protein